MVPDAFREIARHTDVDRAVLAARHDVDEAGLHWSTASGSWTPAFAGELKLLDYLIDRQAVARFGGVAVSSPGIGARSSRARSRSWRRCRKPRRASSGG